MVIVFDADPPGPPENVTVSDLTKSSCTLTWDVPESDGGSAITGYHVEKLSGTRWVKVTKKPVSKCTYELDDLKEGTEYELRVCAENAAGIGEPSKGTSRFIAKDQFGVPGKPDAPIVKDIMEDSAIINFSPPTDDGGATITNYVIEMKSTSETKWKVISKDCKETTFTATGLKIVETYEFRVAAQNKAGIGEPSKPSKPAKYSKIICFTICNLYFSLNYNKTLQLTHTIIKHSF